MRKKQKIIITISTIFLIILILFIVSPLEILVHRDSLILCLNRRFFFTDRYNYKHIIGNYKIKSKYGDIFLKTGDKVNDHKGHLGKFHNINNHTIKILDNDILNIEYIDIYFYDNFSIKLIQELNIFDKYFEVYYIFIKNDIIVFWINDFPEEIILKDNTRINFIQEDDKLFNVSINIYNNKINLNVFDYNKNELYFYVQKNDYSYKCMSINISENWEKIIE